MTDMSMRSAFLALPLEGKPKWQFQALQEALKEWEDIVSFQNPQSPHLTLYFWRELLPIEVNPVLAKAADIADRTIPFMLSVQNAGTFGRAGEERTLFLSVAFSPELATLKKLCPWPNPPGQEFHPHITLARIRHPQKFAVHRKRIFKALGDVAFGFPVTMLRFYAEVEGRKQTPIKEWMLSG